MACNALCLYHKHTLSFLIATLAIITKQWWSVGVLILSMQTEKHKCSITKNTQNYNVLYVQNTIKNTDTQKGKILIWFVTQKMIWNIIR